MKRPHYLTGLPFHLGGADFLQVLRDAARAGIVEAQFELSLALERRCDARGAKRWEAKAAEAGHPRACLNRASRLASANKLAEAILWYEKAAAAGNAEAAARLCKMRLAGQGAARDESLARAWFERASALGYDWSRAGS